MQSLSQKEFNRRWAKAKQSNSSALNLKVTPPKITVTLEGILDKYERQLKQAQTAHAINEQQCQTICKAIADLKHAIQPVGPAIQSYLKT